MTLAVRPDLSQRTALSKSALVGADLCGQKGWFDIRERLPLIKSEKITFGSAMDAAIEQVLTSARAGVPIEDERCVAAAVEVQERDEIAVDLEEIERGVTRFVLEVLPRFDWAYCGLQAHITEDLPGIGEVDGHPDVRLHDGSVFDVKTSARAKPDDGARTSVELGIYGLLSEAERKKPTPLVGYLTWVRTKKPWWQVLVEPFTDEHRRRTRAAASAYVRARAADELLNRNASHPLNFTFPSGPRNLSLCGTCQYNPAFGGPCDFAVQGGVEE